MENMAERKQKPLDRGVVVDFGLEYGFIRPADGPCDGSTDVKFSPPKIPLRFRELLRVGGAVEYRARRTSRGRSAVYVRVLGTK